MKSTLSLTTLTAGFLGLLITGAAFVGSAYAQVPGALLQIDLETASALSVTHNGVSIFNGTQKMKIFSNTPAGTYRVSVNAPVGANTTLTLTRNGALAQEVKSDTIEFNLADGDAARITVTYAYTGFVEVYSDPSGVPFTMESGNGATFTGHTPARFTDMEQGWYMVNYEIQPDCEVQRMLERPLLRNSRITFYRDFNCGDKPVNTAGRTKEHLGTGNKPEPEPAPFPHLDHPAVVILQTASMSEALPGGTVRFTVTVRNVTRSTLHDILVTNTFDENTLDIVLPVGNDGFVAGNEIAWGIPTLYAGQTWTTTFEGRVPTSLVAGDRIVLTARAQNDLIDALYPQEWSSTAGVGVAYLPQTGWGADLLAAIALAIGAVLTTTSTILRKKHVALTA